MEWFWKWLQQTANKELTKRELRQRTAGIINRLDILSGEISAGFDKQTEALALSLRTQVSEEISDQFATAGPLIVQRINETVGPKLNDVAVVIRDVVEERTQKGFQLAASLLGRILGNQAVDSKKAEKRHNLNMQGFDELGRQGSLHDQANSDRYLSLVEAFRKLNAKVDHNNNVQQSMQVKFFQSLTRQIEMATAKPKERYSAAPKLTWLFDNIDHIMDLCDALRNAKSNDAPRSTMTMKAISAIRSMELFSIANIRPELERLFKAWDNDSNYAEAA